MKAASFERRKKSTTFESSETRGQQMIEDVSAALDRQKLCDQFCGERTKAQLDKIMEKFLDFSRIYPTYDEMKEIIAWAVANGAKFEN
jgi:hypothetical protein